MRVVVGVGLGFGSAVHSISAPPMRDDACGQRQALWASMGISGWEVVSGGRENPRHRAWVVEVEVRLGRTCRAIATQEPSSGERPPSPTHRREGQWSPEPVVQGDVHQSLVLHLCCRLQVQLQQTRRNARAFFPLNCLFSPPSRSLPAPCRRYLS